MVAKRAWASHGRQHRTTMYVPVRLTSSTSCQSATPISSTEPWIELFGYLRHGLVGRGVMLFGVILLLLNFVDGLYKLAKLNWHIAYQTAMAVLYVALSIRLIQLILAFRGGE